MYTTRNFKTKKALKEAVANGMRVGVFQPNDMFSNRDWTTFSGQAVIEGPHAPEPHRWYAKVEVVDGAITSVK